MLFSAEKMPTTCWAVCLSLMVHGAILEIDQKIGAFLLNLVQFSGHLYQFTIQRALEELCLQYYSRYSAINIALDWFEGVF